MDKDFADIIQRMASERGKEVLVNGKAKTYLGDYCGGQFKKEASIFRQILDANCGEHINNADNVPERKQKLMEQLENDNGLSPKATAEYLDLLGLILKGDTSKCGGTTIPSSASPPIQMPTTSQAQLQPITPPSSASPPNDAAAYYERGNAHLEKKEYKHAISDYDEAIKINPDYAEAYIKRGLAYAGKKNNNIAIADYTEAIRINSHDLLTSVAYFCRGNVYLDKNDYNSAITDYTEAIRINPDYAEAYYNRSKAYSGKGHGYKKLADADYKVAVKLDPNIIYKYGGIGGMMGGILSATLKTSASAPKTKKP